MVRTLRFSLEMAAKDDLTIVDEALANLSFEVHIHTNILNHSHSDQMVL